MNDSMILQSILYTIKKMLGLDPEYDVYDADIIVYINSALMYLSQLGVGPAGGFQITSSNETWADFIGDDEVKLASVKPYVYMRTRLLFDPPSSSFVVTSMENNLKELEWRLNVRAEEV